MISILIPSHHEPLINDVVSECERLFHDSEIIVCNDRYGNGKGWAVRQAMLYCKGDVICLIDGDMDIHPRMILRLIPFLEDYDIVLGKKQGVKRLSRRILTHLSRLYIRTLFGLGYDTQTGLKLFKRNIVPYWSSNSFSFDLEILTLAKTNGAKIIEVPIEVTEKGKSSKPMKFRNILRALFESFKIWINTR
jgi:glycosyltransferase involved in cell wall biosynthesis